MSDEHESRTIDSHHHFWTIGNRDYPWMAGLDSITRDFGPDDLQPLLDDNGIDATVLIQTVSEVAETREFLLTAAEIDYIAGVVGWVDLAEPGVAATLADLKSQHGGSFLVGIRHQIHDEGDPAWFRREDARRGLKAILDAGLAYDVLVRTRELPAAIETVGMFPEGRFVIDHLAKPPIASGQLEPWASLMREFGPMPNVACKLSGLVTEANHDAWTPEDLKPYVATVLEIFGPERCMFGSDWPVCLLAASYDQVVATLRTLLRELGVDAAGMTAIFGAAVAKWYQLDA